MLIEEEIHPIGTVEVKTMHAQLDLEKQRLRGMIDRELELIKRYSQKNQNNETNQMIRTNMQSVILEENVSLSLTNQGLIDPSFVMAQHFKPLLSTKSNYSSALQRKAFEQKIMEEIQ